MDFWDSKAMSRGVLPGEQCDPTRWGSHVRFTVDVATGVDTNYVYGPQAALMQFSELQGRAIDVIAFYNIEGILITDGPFQEEVDGFTGFGLEWTVGGGQMSFTWTSSVAASIAASANLNGWTTKTDRGHIVTGVLQANTPVAAVSMSLRPVFRLKTNASAAHTLTISADVYACPRSAP